jgi:phosphatidylinositol glycan class K
MKSGADNQFNTYDPARIHSHPGISTELSPTQPDEILVTDFFGGVVSVEVTPKADELDPMRTAGSAGWVSGRRRDARGIGQGGQSSPSPSRGSPRRTEGIRGWANPTERQAEGGWVGNAALSVVLLGIGGYLLIGPRTHRPGIKRE